MSRPEVAIREPTELPYVAVSHRLKNAGGSLPSGNPLRIATGSSSYYRLTDKGKEATRGRRVTMETDVQGRGARDVAGRRGELRPGLTIENAQAEFTFLSQQLVSQHPEQNSIHPGLIPLEQHVRGTNPTSSLGADVRTRIGDVDCLRQSFASASYPELPHRWRDKHAAFRRSPRTNPQRPRTAL